MIPVRTQTIQNEIDRAFISGLLAVHLLVRPPEEEPNLLQILLADVSDGLCSAIYWWPHAGIQVDCGSQEGGTVAAEAWARLLHPKRGAPWGWPAAFILTHLHTDHYNGVLHASASATFPSLHSLREVFSAGMPRVPERTQFLRALFAIAFRTLGSDTGHMEYDFLRAVVRLNGGRKVSYRRLFQGDQFAIGGAQFECIWPPREVADRPFEARVKKALDSFREACEVDPVLRQIEERIDRDRFYTNLLAENADTITFDESEFDPKHAQSIEFPREIPPATKKANKSLTEIANHLSLAFRAGSWLVMWGDVSQSRLPSAVEFLRSSRAHNFDCMVAPHHGTYWHDCLLQLRSENTLISHGPKLISKFRPEWKCISGSVDSTYVGGDLDLCLGPC